MAGSRPLGRPLLWMAMLGVALSAACTQLLDAGFDQSHGLLPVDERNPVIVYEDDWSGDWLGEYAVLLANTGGPRLAGIIVNASKIWGDLSINTSGWNDLVNAARSSGLANIPDVTSSAGTPFTMPSDGNIDSTVPNNSAGGAARRHFVAPAEPAGSPGRDRVGHFADECGGCLLDRSDGYRSCRLVVASPGRHHSVWRVDGAPPTATHGSVGGLDRRPALSLRSGQHLLRSDRRRDDGGDPQLAGQRHRNTDREQAAEHHRGAAGLRPGRAPCDGPTRIHHCRPTGITRYFGGV